MKKNTSFMVALMAIIGVICTGIIAFVLLKDRFCDSFDDDDFDLEDEFMDDEEPETEAEEEEVVEEEIPTPKARRGYIPLKFNN